MLPLATSMLHTTAGPPGKRGPSLLLEDKKLSAPEVAPDTGKFVNPCCVSQLFMSAGPSLQFPIETACFNRETSPVLLHRLANSRIDGILQSLWPASLFWFKQLTKATVFLTSLFGSEQEFDGPPIL